VRLIPGYPPLISSADLSDSLGGSDHEAVTGPERAISSVDLETISDPSRLSVLKWEFGRAGEYGAAW